MQAAYPHGKIGYVIGVLMNLIHTNLYLKYFNKYKLKSNSVILDIGCGGGKFIKRISKQPNILKVIGVDHSSKMIELSQNINEDEIKKGKVEIIKTSLPELPFSDYSFDYITAFETIQFWTDIPKSLAEIKRVLSKEGTFMIINRFPSSKSKWYNKVQIKSEEQYILILKQAGLEITDIKHKNNWIIIKTR